jgi:general secretion pathway protein I
VSRFGSEAHADRVREHRAPQAGFSLLEVLAAFVILALVATALFRLLGGALGNAGVAEDASRAILLAQSRLDAARGEPRAGNASGTEDERFAWTTRVAPWEAPDATPAAGGAQQVTPTQLFRISVEVRYPGAGGRERTLELATLKLARREGSP